MKPFWKIEKEYARQYRKDKANYEKDCKNAGKNNEPMPEHKPIPKSCYTNQTTIQGLIKILKNVPKGIFIYRDEIVAFLESLLYSKGNGSEMDYTELWKSRMIRKDLKTEESEIIEEPFICLLGNTTPNNLNKFLGNGKDKNGFFARFLPCYPEKPKEPNRLVNFDISDYSKEYEELIRHYHNLIPDHKNIRLSDNAFKVFEVFFNDMQKQFWQSETLAQRHGKIIDYVLRFSIVLEALYSYYDNRPLQDISGSIMEKSIILGKYFIEHQTKVYSEADKQQTENSKLDLSNFEADIYNSLAEVFQTKEARKNFEKFCQTYNRKNNEKSFYNFIGKLKRTGLIQKLKHGTYAKEI